MQPTVTIHKLPKLSDSLRDDASARRLATKHRNLRLHALCTSPDAFASSYDVETHWGLERTMERLRDPQAVQFVAATFDDQDYPDELWLESMEKLISASWVGFIALLGPVPSKSGESSTVSAKSDPFAQMQASGLSSNLVRTGAQAATKRAPETPGGKTLDFHIGAVFVDPSVRKGGVGKALIEAALSEAEVQVRSHKVDGFECTIHGDTYNDPAIKLYQKAGFAVVGEETYAQQTAGSPMDERVAYLMVLERAVSSRA